MRSAQCGICDKGFVTDQPHRRNCYECSPARLRSGEPASVTPIRPEPGLPVPAAPAPVPGPRSPGRVETVVRAELEELDALNTVDGALCEGLARGLDDPDLPGAQRSSMSKQLSAMMDAIRAAAPQEADEVDTWAEIARRRFAEINKQTGSSA